MTTAPDTAAADTQAADLALAALAATSADVLTGIINACMLDEVGTPGKLPHYLFPGIAPEHVEQVWDLALAVGFRAGRLTSHRWDPAPLVRAQTALGEAGFQAMAASTNLAATVAPPRRPADDDLPVGGGHR